MKKIDIKHVLVGCLTFFLAFLVKGILDGIKASTITYIFAWIPIVIGFVYDYKYIRRKIDGGNI